jgi:DNA-directed RNA polymerase subunit RPC12/RpoP
MVAPVITPSTVKGGDSKQADSSDVPPILWLAIGGLFLLTILAAILLLVLLLKPVEAAPEPAATTKAANTRKDAPQYAVFPCTACGRKLKIKAAPVGKKVKCPHCTAIVTVVASP